MQSQRYYPTFRLDYNLSQAHRASFSYNYQKFTDYPDGQRFFLNVPEEGTAAPAVTPMTVVLNWTALLQRK